MRSEGSRRFSPRVIAAARASRPRPRSPRTTPKTLASLRQFLAGLEPKNTGEGQGKRRSKLPSRVCFELGLTGLNLQAHKYTLIIIFSAFFFRREKQTKFSPWIIGHRGLVLTLKQLALCQSVSPVPALWPLPTHDFSLQVRSVKHVSEHVLYYPYTNTMDVISVRYHPPLSPSPPLLE